MPSTRRLAAIMFTDIQGYTALMQQDEEEAIKIRTRHRDVFNNLTAKFNGKILQYFGDGTLSIFDSAIDAVRCGMELQLAFQQEPVIPVRIGIHSGDIIFSDDDVIGDGVNVASRIESLAVPGSVFISDKVYDEIKNQPSIQTKSLKTFELKNVDRPMEVFAISNKGLVIPGIDEIDGKTADSDLKSRLPDKKILSKKKKRIRYIFPSALFILVFVAVYLVFKYVDFSTGSKIDSSDKSIAVLAFDNMSNDPDQEYFSDGISEEILNALVKLEGLNVAGRTSSFSYKGKDIDIRTIGDELNVSMVLEGSVRKSGNRVRVTAQLINVDDGYHLWSEQYDRELDDIFAIQEEIADNIAGMLKLTVLDITERTLPTENIDAYELYLKGVYFLRQDLEGTEKALEYFQKAIDVDPNYALAYAGLADAYLDHAGYGLLPAGEAYQKAREAAIKSISLDKNQAYGHKVMAYVHMFFDWDWKAAKAEYDKAIELGLPNPDHFITWYNAFLYADFEKAIDDAKILRQRSPLSIEAHWHLGVCYLLGGLYDSAIVSFNATLELDSNYSEGYRWLANTYSLMGKNEEAMFYIEKALEKSLGQGPAIADLLLILATSGQREEAQVVFDFMREDAETGGVPPTVIASGYSYLGDFDEAFKWLDRSFQEKTMWLVTLKVHPMWDALRDDPRFDEYIERMDFPE